LALKASILAAAGEVLVKTSQNVNKNKKASIQQTEILASFVLIFKEEL